MNLLTYIQGKRKGKEAHRIEKEAMRDPFLADALEGYDAVKADHAERIARLRNRMPSATRYVAGKQKIYIGIAASLLFCLMAGGYFLLNKKPQNLIAMSDSYEYMITEEEIEMSPLTEAPPPPQQNYLTENEQATAAQRASRQRIAPDSPSPVSPEIPVIVIVEDEAVVMAAEMASPLITGEITDEADYTADAALGAAGAAESKTVVAARALRSDLPREALSMPAPQIGMPAYEKYLKESMRPLNNEDCDQTTGTVEVEFTVKEGKPSDFVIKQSFCEAASKEAIRLIENGCPWIGEDGRKVVLRVEF